MSKLATLRLDGDLQQGVRVVLTIATLNPLEDLGSNTEISGTLPPNDCLVNLIKRWQFNYRNLSSSGSTNRMKPNGIIIDASIPELLLACQELDRDLRSQLNNWLSSSSFSPILKKWQEELTKDEVQVLVRASNQALLEIPWHLWDLIESNPRAEVALSCVDGESVVTPQVPTLRGKVRILAILGNRENIDVEKDRELLKKLPDAELVFLDEPKRKDINDELWDQNWDILYFAGHSRTEGEKGRIYINKTDSLTLKQLKYALEKAVSKGLKLAIFNSCDGMGLGFELQQLHLPQAIVMREPVPDEIAQDFLRHFLPEFARGQSLYLAEREARLRLHGREDEFPGASWLPVLFQSPATTAPTWLDLGRRPTTLCPYRGLFAFREEDAMFFHGRENFTQPLVEAIQRGELVSVIGDSGSGKSSVVFAGLVPRLRQQNSWGIVAFRPGQRPFQSIASAWVVLTDSNQSQAEQLAEAWHTDRDALHTTQSQAEQLAEAWHTDRDALHTTIDTTLRKSPGTKLLFIVDQFEELYTQCQDVQERQAFIDSLLKVVELPNVALVLTLRTDFLGQALAYSPLTDVLSRGNRMLGAMSRAELQAAISQPAALLGVTLEEGLTDRTIEAVSRSEGNLPLLEFALEELWKKRQGTLLTHAAYDEIGGLEAAMTRHMEQAFSSLSDSEQEQSRQIFIQLVRPGEGTVDTRRVATRAEIGDENWLLVTRLASDRLVVTRQKNKIDKTETVELVHEALITKWSRLQDWIRENRDFRLWQESLRSTIQQWEKSNRDEEVLLRGKPLADAENWLQQRSTELTTEREFIHASTAQQKRQKRQRILMFGSISVVGFILTTFAGVAVWRTNTANANANLRELAAASETLFKVYQQKKKDEKSTYNLENKSKQELDRLKQDSIDRYQDALVTALKAGKELQQTNYSVDLTTRFQVLTALNQAVYEGKFGTKVQIPECPFYAGTRNEVAFNMSNNNKTISCSNSDGTVRLFDRATGRKLNVFRGNANWIKDVHFSPDGKTMASDTIEGDVNLWDRATNKVIKTLKGHFSEVNKLEFSPDGQIVAAGNFDGTIILWNIATGQEVKILKGHSGIVDLIKFSPDGQMMASVNNSNPDREMKLWDLQTGKIIKKISCTFKSRCDTVDNISFSFDSQTIIYATGKHMTLWDIKNDRLIKTIKTINGTLLDNISVSPDGQIVASSLDKSGNNTVILRDFSTGKILKTLSNRAGKVSRAMSRWDDIGDSTRKSRVNHISFSPNSKLIAVASSDRTMSLWNSSTGEKLKTFQDLIEWTGSIDFSPNGKLIATTGMDAHNQKSEVKLWDISTGKLFKTLIQEPVKSANGISLEVRFSPDSQTIAIISSDSTTRLWNISTGQELNIPGLTNSTPLNRPQIPMQEGKIIATKMPDGRVKRWERSTGKELEPFYWYKVLTSTSQVSDDRKTSTVIDWDGLKKVRDIATGKELNSVKLDFSVTSNIEISHDGSTIVAATPKGVKIWNASNGKEISVLKGDSKNSEDWTINRLYFSPDDKTIVTGNYIGFPGQSGRKYAQNTTSKWSLKLWNIQTGKTIETFKSQLNAANYVAFSPDNQTIAFAKTDGSIELRDFLTGKAITTLNRHLKQVDLLEFSSDGKMLLSSTDGSSGLDELKLWDLATGQEIKTYKDNIDVEWKIPGGAGFWFDPDGRTILLLDRDNVTTWDLDLENLLKRGCEQVRDNPKAKDLCNIKSIWDL